jgi:thiosulfate dehydrogenase [quinone] large subunit
MTSFRAKPSTPVHRFADSDATGVAVRPSDYIWAIVRISIGLVFPWAFLDKTFGWGFATPPDRAWVRGASPTTGFFKGTKGQALGGVFTPLAGQAWADWLFMIGLLCIGVALIVGAGMWMAAVTGGLLLILMWAVELPLKQNPFMDDHLIYAMVLVGLALAGAGDVLGIGRWWSGTPGASLPVSQVVQRHGRTG